MKVLIFVSCAFAVASAGLNHINPWAQLQHIPVIGPNGVPVEPAEVQIARAQHLAAHGHSVVSPLAHISSGVTVNGLPLDTPEVAAAKLQHHHDYAVAAHNNGVAVGLASPLAVSHVSPLIAGHVSPLGLSHGAVIGVNGAPLETPEVQAATAAHIAAHIEANARVGHVVSPHSAVYGLAAVGVNGVPLDTPEVAAAKAHHLAAHAEAAHRSLLAPSVW